jgi:hypothetical protein
MFARVDSKKERGTELLALFAQSREMKWCGLSQSLATINNSTKKANTTQTAEKASELRHFSLLPYTAHSQSQLLNQQVCSKHIKF